MWHLSFHPRPNPYSYSNRFISITLFRYLKLIKTLWRLITLSPKTSTRPLSNSKPLNPYPHQKHHQHLTSNSSQSTPSIQNLGSGTATIFTTDPSSELLTCQLKSVPTFLPSIFRANTKLPKIKPLKRPSHHQGQINCTLTGKIVTHKKNRAKSWK